MMQGALAKTSGSQDSSESGELKISCNVCKVRVSKSDMLAVLTNCHHVLCHICYESAIAKIPKSCPKCKRRKFSTKKVDWNEYLKHEEIKLVKVKLAEHSALLAKLKKCRKDLWISYSNLDALQAKNADLATRKVVLNDARILIRKTEIMLNQDPEQDSLATLFKKHLNITNKD